MANWGDLMESLHVYAVARVYDPCGPWQCFLIAMNPQDQDEIFCIVSGGKNIFPEVTEWTLYELSFMYNAQGESLQVDEEYRPKMAYQVLNELRGIYERT